MILQRSCKTPTSGNTCKNLTRTELSCKYRRILQVSWGNLAIEHLIYLTNISCQKKEWIRSLLQESSKILHFSHFLQDFCKKIMHYLERSCKNLPSFVWEINQGSNRNYQRKKAHESHQWQRNKNLPILEVVIWLMLSIISFFSAIFIIWNENLSGCVRFPQNGKSARFWIGISLNHQITANLPSKVTQIVIFPKYVRNFFFSKKRVFWKKNFRRNFHFSFKISKWWLDIKVHFFSDNETTLSDYVEPMSLQERV